MDAQLRLDYRLCRVAEWGTLEDVAALLDAGARVDGGRCRLPAPLLAASRCGHLAVVNLLLARGAPPNTEDGHSLALHSACIFGHLDVAGALVAAGADVERSCRPGQTLLWACVAADNVAAAAFLLDHGADTEARDSNGDTPLIWAVANERYAMAKVLAARATVDATRPGGRTALHRAAAGRKPVRMACLLVRAGARDDIADGRGLCALDQMAAEQAEKVRACRRQ